MKATFVIVFLQLLHVCVCLERHALQIRILSYKNFYNEVLRSSQYVCCDGPSNSNDCERCDTYFRYCLRIISPRFSSFECPSNGRTLVSEVNTDDGPLDFSMSTVLGLPNPFVLSGFQDPEDFELLVVALDRDFPSTFEVIDFFDILLEDLRQGRPETIAEDGANRIIRLRLELTLTCEEGYTGELCDREEETVSTAAVTMESPTTAAGTLEPLTTTTVITETAATVQATTENPRVTTTNTIKTTQPLNKENGKVTTTTPLDDCADTNCSEHSVCFRNENNVSCVCQPGFTGPNCTVQTNRIMKKGDDIGGIIGGTIGSLIVILLLVALILGVAIVFALKRKHQVNEQNATIEQYLPPMIITNENRDYQNGMIKNVLYGMRLDTGQQQEAVENIYDTYDQVREESHLYEDMTESVDHFQINFNIVYKETEDY